VTHELPVKGVAWTGYAQSGHGTILHTARTRFLFPEPAFGA